MKDRKTTIKKQGQGFKISFSEKDGKDLAKELRNGGSLHENKLIKKRLATVSVEKHLATISIEVEETEE